MTTLHIVRTSAFTSNDFAQCLQVSKANDFIVLTDDGCYNVKHPLINAINGETRVMVINDHAQARAVEITNTKTTLISMTQLVALTFQANRVITWQ